MATLAAATTQSQDPAMSLVFASVVELIRKSEWMTEPAKVEEILEASSKASTSFIKLYRPNHLVPHPQHRGWILILLLAALAVAILLLAFVIYVIIFFLTI